jgi:hypothetical protein
MGTIRLAKENLESIQQGESWTEKKGQVRCGQEMDWLYENR